MTTPVAPTRTPGPPPAMFSTLRIASTGLSAQSFKMEIIAQNLANAETTRTPGGGPYQRRTVVLQPESGPNSGSIGNAVASALGVGDTAASGVAASPSATGTAATPDDPTGGVRVASVGIDTTDGPLIYDPGHPDADANGYVRMPNVNMTDELMDLMTTRRLFQANATVFEAAKSMLSEAAQI